MKTRDFEMVVDKRFAECREILLAKNKEYAEEGDKLSNFKEAADLKGESPEMALWGFWVKHIIGMKKIVLDLELDDMEPSETMMRDKFSDMINYALLLEALIRERKKDDSNNNTIGI